MSYEYSLLCSLQSQKFEIKIRRGCFNGSAVRKLMLFWLYQLRLVLMKNSLKIGQLLSMIIKARPSSCLSIFNMHKKTTLIKEKRSCVNVKENMKVSLKEAALINNHVHCHNGFTSLQIINAFLKCGISRVLSLDLGQSPRTSGHNAPHRFLLKTKHRR